MEGRKKKKRVFGKEKQVEGGLNELLASRAHTNILIKFKGSLS